MDRIVMDYTLCMDEALGARHGLSPFLLEAVRLGVRGVVSKDASSELLLKAIRSVLAGQYWLGREEVADVVRSLLRTSPDLNGRNGRKARNGRTPAAPH